MKKKWIFAGLLFFNSILAGESVAEGAKPLIGEEKPLADRVEALEKNLGLKVGFLLQAQYVHNSLQTVSGNFDQFLGKRAEVKLSSELKQEKILGVLVYDPTQSASKQLKDYYIRFSQIPDFEVQFGQGKYPQALEGRTPSGELDFSNRALVSSVLGDKRDLFLQLGVTGLSLGDAKWNYALALVQGAGQNVLENNSAKDLAGRIGLDWEGFHIGISGYEGWELTGRREAWGVEGRWISGDFKFQWEYLLGLLEPGNAANPIPLFQDLHSRPRGYYATAQYRLEEFRFGARWESYDPDTTSGSAFDTHNDVLTLEAAWFQSKDRFKFSLDFEEHLGQYQTFIVQTQLYL